MDNEIESYENLKAEISKLKFENEFLRNELKKNESILHEKNYLLNIFTENMFDKIVLCDMQGNYKYLANSKRLLGFEENELIGQNALSFIHPDDFSHIQASFIDFLSKSDELIKEEYRHLKSDGTYSWLETIGKVLKDEAGNDKEILFCSRDISDRVLFENELQKSEAQYRLILDNAHESIFILQNGRFVYHNPITSQISGYSKKEFDEMNFLEFIHPEDRQRVIANYQKRLAGEKIDSKHEYRIISKEGKPLWSELRAADTLWNNEPATIYFANDITERKIVEAALRESEDKFSSLLNSMKEFVFIKDENLRYIFANKALQEYHGLSDDRILGKSDYDLMPDSAAEQCEISDNIAKSSYSKHVSEEVINGRLYETHKYPVPIRDGVFGVGGYIIDITEKRNAEIALLKSDKLISSFLANISHEIRTPMNGILGFMTLMNDYDFSREEKQDFYIEFKKSGNRLMNTIDDLLEISKIQTNQIEIKKSEFDLQNLLVDLFDDNYFYAQNKGLDFKFSHESYHKNCLVYTDRFILKKMISMLINNSIKFTKVGFVELGCRVNADTFEIYVRDTGVGISKENMESIFERFVQAESELTREYEGSGLGLSIVKSYCEILGGEVRVESKLGKGSEFTISFAR